MYRDDLNLESSKKQNKYLLSNSKTPQQQSWEVYDDNQN